MIVCIKYNFFLISNHNINFVKFLPKVKFECYFLEKIDKNNEIIFLIKIDLCIKYILLRVLILSNFYLYKM